MWAKWIGAGVVGIGGEIAVNWDQVVDTTLNGAIAASMIGLGHLGFLAVRRASSARRLRQLRARLLQEIRYNADIAVEIFGRRKPARHPSFVAWEEHGAAYRRRERRLELVEFVSEHYRYARWLERLTASPISMDGPPRDVEELDMVAAAVADSRDLIERGLFGGPFSSDLRRGPFEAWAAGELP